jgi:hypothetical protein
MNYDQEMAEVVATLHDALEKSERALQGWLEGRVAPTEHNREHYSEMAAAARNACDWMDTENIGRFFALELVERLRRVRDGLAAVVAVELALDRLDEVARRLAALAHVPGGAS